MTRRPPEPRAPAGPPLSALPGLGLSEDEVELGHVQAPFGVRGEVKLFLHNRESELFDRPRAYVFVANDGRRFSARMTARPGAGLRVLGRVEGVGTPELAATLTGWTFGIGKADLPALAEGEFYVGQIEGADVRIDGVTVGTLVTVQSTEGPDVLVIRTATDTALVPCTEEFVVRLSVADRVVELVPGALEEG